MLISKDMILTPETDTNRKYFSEVPDNQAPLFLAKFTKITHVKSTLKRKASLLTYPVFFRIIYVKNSTVKGEKL